MLRIETGRKRSTRGLQWAGTAVLRGRREQGSTEGPPKPPSWGGTIFLSLFLLVFVAFGVGFGVAGAANAVQGMGYALRDSGVPGTLVIDGCLTSGSGHTLHTTCSGDFTSTDGRSGNQFGQIDATVKIGTTLQVQEEPVSGDCYQLGPERVAGWAAMFFTALGALLIGLLGVYGIFAAFRSLLRSRVDPAPVRATTAKEQPEPRRPKTRRDRFNKGYFLTMAACFGLAALSGVVAGVAAIARLIRLQVSQAGSSRPRSMA